MRVLFDIVHPANVLFFYHTMKVLQKRGDDNLILSRHKDVTCDLLDQFGLLHTPISTAGSGKIGLGLELVRRDLAMFAHVRRFRPDIMIGFGGVAISHVSKATGIPAISFYDSDNATLQNAISLPFITHVYVPEAYQAKTPSGRTTRFRGLKEMSYFHPNRFVPDEAIARKSGWEADKENFFIRTVQWRANHDMGKSGWSDDTLAALVDQLSRRGRVHISTERPLSSRFDPFRYRGSKTDIHHLMAHCRLYVGESATMAQESILLGTPSIYAGYDLPGVTGKLVEDDLLRRPVDTTTKALVACVQSWLDEPVSAFQARRAAFLERQSDLTQVILSALQTHAKGKV